MRPFLLKIISYSAALREVKKISVFDNSYVNVMSSNYSCLYIIIIYSSLSFFIYGKQNTFGSDNSYFYDPNLDEISNKLIIYLSLSI